MELPASNHDTNDYITNKIDVLFDESNKDQESDSERARDKPQANCSAHVPVPDITNTANFKRKMKRELKTPTEILLERQVELFEQQLEFMKEISSSLKQKIKIDEKRLKLEMEQVQIQKEYLQLKRIKLQQMLD